METIIAFTLGVGIVIFILIGIHTFKVVGQLKDVDEDIKLIFESLSKFSFQQQQDINDLEKSIENVSRDLSLELRDLSKEKDDSIELLHKEVSEVYRQMDSRYDKLYTRLETAPKTIIKD